MKILRKLRDESGQVMVLTLLCMTALIGFMALAIDVGVIFRAKRNMQIAADAAATAAALDYSYNNTSGTAIAAAKTVGANAATANGYSSASGATVTINSGNNGEITTPWHNAGGFFEAIISQPSPTFFMGYFGVGSMTVKARAVAGTPGPGIIRRCVQVNKKIGNLGPGKSSGDSTVFLQGSFNLNAPNCGILIDGSGSDTLHYTGNGGQTHAAWIAVVGGAGGNVSGYTPAPVTGVTAVTDPLLSRQIPDGTGVSCLQTGGTVTGNIGSPNGTVKYCGNLTVQNATFAGTVIFSGGDVSFGGNISTVGNATTSGATLVFADGGFTEGSNTVFNLWPQLSGPLSSVVLAAPLSNTSTMQLQFGNSTGKFHGNVDMPGATLLFQDSGTDHSGGLTFDINLDIGQLDDKTTTLNINGYTPPAGTPDPLAVVTLVE